METKVEDIGGAPEAAVRPYQNEIQELTNVIVRRLPSFHRIALKRLGNVADAEDAVQDAFLSAYTHLGQFKGQAKMSTWLTAIVINSARMKVRSRLRQVYIALDEEDEGRGNHSFAEMLSDQRPTPEEVCQRLEREELMVQLSQRLSPNLRRTFQLRDMVGFSTRQTAKVLGVPIGTVKAHLSRARMKLKQLMQINLTATDRWDAVSNAQKVFAVGEQGLRT
jgi:RNA polymerase sigma-70 factor (ECF subfamily)